jgi:serine protease
MADTDLETAGTTTASGNTVSSSSHSTADAASSAVGSVTTFVTGSKFPEIQDSTRFIVGYSHENSSFSADRLGDLHTMENKFLDNMGITRYTRQQPENTIHPAPFDRMEVPTGKFNSTEDIAQEMNKNFKEQGGTGTEVAYVEPDYTIQAFSTAPDDPSYDMQWNMQDNYMDIPDLHEITSGSSDITVAVIDTGVYEDGEDFSSDTFVTGYNFCSTTQSDHSVPGSGTTTTDTTDDNGHGTHVTGTIAEETDNGVGVASIAPGVKIMPLKALDSDGSGYTSDICNAIDYAVNNGADIINLSLGSSSTSKTLETACDNARENGVLVVAAAGNDDTEDETYPAAYDSVLAVGAVGYDTSAKASYSNYGDWVDVMAYGGDVDSDDTIPYIEDGTTRNGIYQWTIDPDATGENGGYYYYVGTSMATPHVTALAALLLSKDSSRTPDELSSLICDTATAMDCCKYGLIDPMAAIENDVNDVSDTATISFTSGESQSTSWTLSAAPGDISVSVDVDEEYLSDVSVTLYDEDDNEAADADASDVADGAISLSYTVDATDTGTYTLTITYSGSSS